MKTVSDTVTSHDPVHDAAGNMTELPRPSDPTDKLKATYDAWNRLVKIEEWVASAWATLAEYEYDALGRRTVKKTYSAGSPDEVRDFYYTRSWQVLEERVETRANDVERQYVWGARYVDDLVLRDRDTGDDGDLDQRHFVLQDANFNVTAIVEPDGDVAERYRYTPYGQRAVLNADFTDHSSSGGSYDWHVGFQSLLHDVETGLVNNRFRVWHPTAGRFLQRDPLHYTDGMNLYVGYHVLLNLLDPLGLSSQICDELNRQLNDMLQQGEELDTRSKNLNEARQHWANRHGLPYPANPWPAAAGAAAGYGAGQIAAKEYSDVLFDHMTDHGKVPTSGGGKALNVIGKGGLVVGVALDSYGAITSAMEGDALGTVTNVASIVVGLSPAAPVAIGANAAKAYADYHLNESVEIYNNAVAQDEWYSLNAAERRLMRAAEEWLEKYDQLQELRRKCGCK